MHTSIAATVTAWLCLSSAAFPAALAKAPLPPLEEGTKTLTLIEKKQPRSVILLSETPTHHARRAAEYFVHVLHESTGVKLPILSEAKEASLEAGTVKVYVGDTRAAEAAGIRSRDMPEETYRIVTKPGAVIVVGRDRKKDDPHYVDSLPTRWALNQLLDQYLGVRWLWPGELGTYIPRADTFIVPEMEVSYQPDLMLRRLRLVWRWMQGTDLAQNKLPVLLTGDERDHLLTEAVEWLENHQNGQRGNIRYGHAFSEWWNKYSKDHPDYFAVAPSGVTQPKPNEKSVKLRLANPAVIEQIAAEYEERGRPLIYNVCPNDGYGFDISEETRQWDWPANQNVDDIWIGNGNLTARYVRFWNKLYERLRQINPDVTLISYAYASYRLPPPPEVPLRARMILGIVDSFSGYDTWNKWAAAGARMILRPNWWVVGADAPHIPLKRMSDFMKFVRKNNLVGVDKDSITGYWATQGLNFYTLARLITRPDLDKDEIVAEYASAFGPARETIRKYIRFWEDFTEKAAYPNHAGTIVSENSDGLYERLVREKGIPFNPRLGSYWAMPYLYTDELLDKAEAILNEAKALLKDPKDQDAMKRVDFLQDGLTDLKAVRDLVKAAADLKETPDSESLKAEFTARVDALLVIRRRLATTHAVWGEAIYTLEDKLKIPTRPENLQETAPDLRGM